MRFRRIKYYIPAPMTADELAKWVSKGKIPMTEYKEPLIERLIRWYRKRPIKL